MSARREGIEKLKTELLESAKSLFAGKGNASLLHVLRQVRPDIEFAFVFNWIPEQGEDIYWLLVNREAILIVEVPRPGLENSAPIVQTLDVHTFRRRKLSAEVQRRFGAALELVDEGAESGT